MTHIKIKFKTAICSKGLRKDECKEHNSNFLDEYTNFCDEMNFTKECTNLYFSKYDWDYLYDKCKVYESSNEYVNGHCKHVKTYTLMVEDDIEKFNYVEGMSFKLYYHIIDINAIDYLEIDGEVLIDRKKEGE